MPAIIRPRLIISTPPTNRLLTQKISNVPTVLSPVSGPTKILPWLYLGNDSNAVKKKDFIENVVSFVELSQVRENIEVIPFSDNSDVDIDDIFFSKIFFKLLLFKSLKKTILVNCQYGISRSPTVVAGYIIIGILQRTNKFDNLDERVINYVGVKRETNAVCICPNLGFSVWLSSLQSRIKIVNNVIIVNEKEYEIDQQILSDEDFEIITTSDEFMLNKSFGEYF